MQHKPILCNRCHLSIDHNRANERIVVCNHCGKVYSNSLLKPEAKGVLNFIYKSAVIIVFAFGLLQQVVTWDTASIRVLPYQFKSLVAMDTSKNNIYLAKVCLQLDKLDCYQNYLHKALVRNPKDMKVRAEYGKTLFNTMNYKEAKQTLNVYKRFGGKDRKVIFAYARSLEALGETKSAAREYRWLLRQKPNFLQITVTEQYVKLLMKKGYNFQAKRYIQYVQRNSKVAPQFMQAQLEKLIKLSRVAHR